MILFINACVRDDSRTLRLAKDFLASYGRDESITAVELQSQRLSPLDGEKLSAREKFIAQGNYDNEMFEHAKLFSGAEKIVIAAPYWDYSFPALLKIYIEQLCVMGLTFTYSDEGFPVSLCRLEELVYITTAGGFIPERNYGYDYVREVFTGFFGAKKCRYIKAEGLDIIGSDPDEILSLAEKDF